MTLDEALSAFASSKETGSASVLSYLEPESLEFRNRPVDRRLFLDCLCVSYVRSWTPTRNEDSPPVAPSQFLDDLARLIVWLSANREFPEHDECSETISDLRRTLPRAILLRQRLMGVIEDRHGPFTFPEFLTSFENGGRSEYDVDTPGELGVLEGYFQVVSVNPDIIVEELITERTIAPILLPGEAAALVEAGQILTLELIHSDRGWVIRECGNVFPPGTRIL